MKSAAGDHEHDGGDPEHDGTGRQHRGDAIVQRRVVA
jgi:hypothetical protein